MPFTGSALLAAFVSGIAVRQLWERPPVCVCDSTPPGDAGSADRPLIDLLRVQLERCGPENLHHAPQVVHALQAPAGGSIAWALLALWGALSVGLLVKLSRGTRGPLALKDEPAEHVPRWIPPAGNRARELSRG